MTQSLLHARDHELIREMAEVIEARWREEGKSLLDGIIERLTVEEELKRRASYTWHALTGEAFVARMRSEATDITAATKEAFEWAEGQFIRISRGDVGERDLVG